MSDTPNQNEYIRYKCPNPECGGTVTVKRPATTGNYAVTCPNCGQKRNVKLKGLDSFAKPDNSQKPEITVDGPFWTKEDCSFTCPHCKTQSIQFKTEKPGLRRIACPGCKGPLSFDIENKPAPTRLLDDVTEEIQCYPGKLTLLKWKVLKKHFILREGRTVIGREDTAKPSDISIPNDKGMSRRSVAIDTAHTHKGYTFKFEVLNATNPVLLNGKPFNKGEVEYLRYGDIIVLGKTRFVFDRVE